MKKTSVCILVALLFCCIDVEQIGLFMSMYSKVDSYDFKDSLSDISPDLWSYIPSEKSNITDAMYIKTADGTVFHDKIVLYFDGNDCNLYFSASVGKLFHALGINFFAADYPGYGRTYGDITPSEQSCYQGAEAALQYVQDSLGYPLENIVLCGFSLGSGVAIEMATRYNTSAVLLFAVFVNMDVLVESSTGGYKLPRDWFIDAKFDNISKINQVHVPLCMFAGEKDCLMEPQNMEMLYQKANNPKYHYILKGEGHSCLPVNSYAKWKNIVVEFLNTGKPLEK